MKNHSLFLLLSFLFGWTACQGQFVEWSREIVHYDQVPDTYEEVNRVFSIQLKGGDILIVQNYQVTLEEQYMSFGTRYDSLCLLRVDQNGNVAWRKSLPFTGRGRVYAAAATADSGFVCCGVQANFLSLLKFDKQGNLTLLKQWPKPVQKIYPNNITVGPDGQYYMLTSEFYYKESKLIFQWYYQHIFNTYYNLIKVDKTGNIQWIKPAGSDILTSPDLGFLSCCDTSNIRHIQLYNFMDAQSGAINIINSRPNYYDASSGYANREIALLRYDTLGNLLTNKSLIDTFSLNYINNTTTIKPYNHISDLRNNFSFTGNGYLYRYAATYNIPQDSLFTDSVVQVVYEQTFDGFGNKQDSIVHESHKYYFDLHTEYPVMPVISTQDGQYWSLNDHVWADMNGAGHLAVHRYDSQFRLQEDIPVPGLFPYIQYLRRAIYPSADGGLLSMHIRQFDAQYPNVNPGEGVVITKIGNRANAISYFVYIDKNNNGRRDPADIPYSNALLQTEHRQHTTVYPYTAGEKTIYTDTGQYLSRLVSYYQYLKYFNVSPSEAYSVFSSYNNRDTVEFRLTPRPRIQDLQVSIIPVNTARPGFESVYTLTAGNFGTDTTRNFPVQFIMDPRQAFTSTDREGYTLSGDTLTWVIDSLEPLQTLTIKISCTNAVPPLLDSGDTLTLQAFALPLEPDSARADNAFVLKEPVRNSADPNDKLEAHGAGITTTQLQNRDFLYYTIRFQNTGTDWAYTVTVKDTLSDKLDWSSFEMLNASHLYTLDVTDKRYLTWSFNQIYLPDSTLDEPGSHGFISFRIKPKSGLRVDDLIPNRASIIFDFNPAIVTNTAITQVLQERVTAVNNPAIGKIKLFPSPTDSRFLLDIELNHQKTLNLVVIDLSGKVLQSQPLKGEPGRNVFSIDISEQPNGLYLIRINDTANNLYYGKILKQ